MSQSNDGSASASSTANDCTGGDPSGGSTTSATADSVQTQPQNTNVDVRVNSPGQVGPVTQTNDAQSSAAAGGTAGGSDTADGSSSVATGSATSSQTAPTNSNVQVRVGSPGDDQAVQQANASGADAGAATGGCGADPAGTGSAAAAASQSAPSNVDVTVRVGSAGDNGPVQQTNSVGATAGPGAPSGDPPSSPQDQGKAGTDQTVTTTGSASATNESSAGQAIEQAQQTDPPPAGDASAGTPGPSQGSPAGAPDGVATAAQTGAGNTAVSVRVGSPGKDGQVTQGNTAAANGTDPDVSVVTVTDGTSTDVSVVVPGPTGEIDTDGTWVWTWVWSGDWTLQAGATAEDVAPTAGPDWNWLWVPAPPSDGASTDTSSTDTPPTDPSSTPAHETLAGGDPTQSPPTPGPSESGQGLWTWTWVWTLPSGQTVTGGWQLPCNCNWTWSWTWDWSTAQPAPPTDTPAPTSGATDTTDTADTTPVVADGVAFGSVTQENSATATATASANESAAQSLDQTQTGGDPTLQDQLVQAAQGLESGQSAVALALAAQTGAFNLNLTESAKTTSVAQTNEVSADADAEATATMGQAIVQQQTGNAPGGQTEAAAQQLSSSQSVAAAAVAAQTDPVNADIVVARGQNGARVGAVEQTNRAAATATAAATADLAQWVGQYQIAGDSLLQEADALQLLDSEQTADAAAVVTQDSTTNLSFVVVPAGSRATNPSLRQRNVVFTIATATDTSHASQSIVQAQGGGPGIELAAAGQSLAVDQTAIAYSPAQQDGLLNLSGWRGVEPSSSESGTETAPTLLPPASAPSPTLIVSTPHLGLVWPGLGPLLLPLTGGAGPASVVPVQNRPHTRPGFAPAETQLPDRVAVPPAAERAAPAPASRAASHAGTTASTPLDAEEGLGVGGAGFTFHGGTGGSFGELRRQLTFVAPALIGPQSPAPTLGRSVAFLDPFERPG